MRFPTPGPVALGKPGAGYPLPWLVQTWLPGVTATEQDPGGSAAFAHDLAEFISGVRGISTGGRTFSGSGRGRDEPRRPGSRQRARVRRPPGRVLDAGGLGPADPALDLVAAWHLLEAGPRQVFRDALGCDDPDGEPGKAWAFEQAMGAVWYYADSNIAMSQMARRSLERIQADIPSTRAC